MVVSTAVTTQDLMFVADLSEVTTANTLTTLDLSPQAAPSTSKAIMLRDWDGENIPLTELADMDIWDANDDTYIHPDSFMDWVDDLESLDDAYRRLHAQHDALASRTDLTEAGREVLAEHAQVLADEEPDRAVWMAENEEYLEAVAQASNRCNGWLDVNKGEIMHLPGRDCPKHTAAVAG